MKATPDELADIGITTTSTTSSWSTATERTC